MIAWIVGVVVMLQGAQASLVIPKDKLEKAPPGKTVVGIVNGKTITAAMVQQFLWDWAAYDATQELMTGVMVEDAAKEAGVTASDKEIFDYMETLVVDLRKSLPPGRTIEQEVKAKGIAMSRLLMRSRIEVLVKKIATQRFKPEDARKLSRLVVIAKGSDEAAKAEAKKRAADALTRLRSGADWTTVVNEVSEDNQTKRTAGAIGWLALMEFGDGAALIKDVPAGGYSDPVEFGTTFTIYRVEAVGPPPEDEVQKVREGFLGRNTKLIYEELERKAHMENKIVPAPPKPASSGG
jgi:parvulin-like peptidyl-prolyl isomerase